ncbi:MAG: GGDEF domain-containing protein [Candidatus Mcinerneyibacterium aminivorans]|uniref:GGDEF domain-containing protein n=1 Tax=Candidatus Mcinerneyibacterium aminivorans TaxID=2703815 RepID=A0A5D0MJ73_9BACT|nr:MAG: GGDEF domain-containing protein [Candidatus Mcinerneyibacterium aminivorans]
MIWRKENPMNLCDNKLVSSYFRSSSYEEILSSLMDLIQHKLKLDSIAVYELKNNKFKVKISRGFSSFYIKNFSRGLDDSQISQIINSPLITEVKNNNELVEKSPKYSLFFPLLVKNDKMGFMYMGRNSEFNDDEKNFFQNMGIISAFVLKSELLEESTGKLNIYDNRTSAYKNNYFYLRLKEALNRLEYLEESFSIFYIKYRYFIKVKKAYGKSRINESFNQIFGAIKKNIRPIDHIFRFKEDGFVVLFENHISKNEFEIIETLETQLNSILEKINIKTDIDMALLNITSTLKIEEIINLMEEAIYKSERTGKTIIIEE